VTDHPRTFLTSPLRILIVEDDYLAGLNLEEMVRAGGHEVVGIAASAAQAYELASTTAPTLALMDIRILGPVDGVDAAIELRRKFFLPVIFCSAHDDAETKQRGKLADPVGWLPKPYSQEGLLRMLGQVLDT